jgi:pimeloyl-ACP methyl ester carboxylesterase
LRELGDVIALDQRGVGLSNTVPSCKASAALDPAGGLNERTFTRYYRDTLTKCVAEWRAAGVAVEGYTTPENADDLEALRLALGAPKLRLWAISYGTHLAFEMMRRHPRSVDRVVMASVEGMDQTVKLPARVDAALGRLAGAAAANDLLATMRRVHAKLDATPQAMTVGDATGQVSFSMDSFALRSMIGGIAKNPAGIGQLAQLYGAFDAGQGQAVAPLLYGAFLSEPLTMTGMPELMDLASGISRKRLGEFGREATTAIVGTATNFPMPQVSGLVPAIDLGDAFRTDVRSSIPTLVFSGDLDLRTPLEEQAAATNGLRRLTTVVVRNGGHDLYETDPAIAGMIATFFKGGNVTQTTLTLPPASAKPAR